MLPTHLQYPHFVPDQLLRAEHLNQVFAFLDEQGRMTRTNLIGMGIVCGLVPQLSADGRQITLSAGVGVTSQGHLIAIESRSFSRRKSYPVDREKVYSAFVDEDLKPRFPVDELLAPSETEGTQAFDRKFLAGKQLLLFVELETIDAKNCQPDSCDDKGRQIHWNLRVLLVPRDAMAEAHAAYDQAPIQTLSDLPWVRMPRFDVEATALMDTSSLIAAYQKILGAKYLARWEKMLSETYLRLAPWVHDLYSGNPFKGFASRFSAIHPSSKDLFALIHIQYYYDYLADVNEAYTALRELATRLISLCQPQADPFPRHLLLGLADPSEDGAESPAYRHRFIPSRAISGEAESIGELRNLFRRLVEIVRGFSLPQAEVENWRRPRSKNAVRITPSRWGNPPFTGKAIPYYYRPDKPGDPLYKLWDPVLRQQGRPEQTLSYHSDQYNLSDDFVKNPLAYDLEPYNFLRIEGHLGMHIRMAVELIQQARGKQRLPFDLLPLGTDLRGLTMALRKIGAGDLEDLGPWAKAPCLMTDLQAQYASWREAMICFLCQQMKNYYPMGGSVQYTHLAPNTAAEAQVSALPLFQRCDPAFSYYPGTWGAYFELFYQQVSQNKLGFLSHFATTTYANFPTGTQAMMGLMYLLHELAMSLPENLDAFSLKTYGEYIGQIHARIKSLRALLDQEKMGDGTRWEDLTSLWDRWDQACVKKEIQTIYTQYLRRKAYAYFLGKLGYFAYQHPGIQHKGGVPMGGTFLIIYHDSESEGAQSDSQKRILDLNPTNLTYDSSAMNPEGIPTVEGSAHTYSNQPSAASPLQGGMRINKAAAQEDPRPGTLEGKIAEALAYFRDWEAEHPPTDQDSHLASLLEDLRPGTVIADFFLPYHCGSDCPPIQFTMPAPAPPKEDLRIHMEPDQFCAEDKGQYAVEVFPQGGKLQGEGVREKDGQFVFSPSAIDLGSEPSRAIELTYSRGDDQTSITVQVFAPAYDQIQAESGADPMTWSFSTAMGLGDQWHWDFGDGETSQDSKPQHKYQKEGGYQVRLKLSHGPCPPVEIETRIEVKGKPKLPMKCLPLADLLKTLQGFSKKYPKVYASYSKSNPAVLEFAHLLTEVHKMGPQELEKYLQEIGYAERMQNWINHTVERMYGKEWGPISIEFFELLLAMNMHLACGRQGQIGKPNDPLALDALFKLLDHALSFWNKESWPISTQIKQNLNQVLNLCKQELARAKEAGWGEEAHNYVYLLQQWVRRLEKLVQEIA